MRRSNHTTTTFTAEERSRAISAAYDLLLKWGREAEKEKEGSQEGASRAAENGRAFDVFAQEEGQPL